MVNPLVPPYLSLPWPRRVCGVVRLDQTVPIEGVARCRQANLRGKAAGDIPQLSRTRHDRPWKNPRPIHLEWIRRDLREARVVQLCRGRHLESDRAASAAFMVRLPFLDGGHGVLDVFSGLIAVYS